MQPMRITVTLNSQEGEALRKASISDLRKPKDQVRVILRQALGLSNAQNIHISEQTQNGAGVVRQDLTSAVL